MNVIATITIGLEFNASGSRIAPELANRHVAALADAITQVFGGCTVRKAVGRFVLHGRVDCEHVREVSVCFEDSPERRETLRGFARVVRDALGAECVLLSFVAADIEFI